MDHQLKYKVKSVKIYKSIQSVIQTSYDIIKAHGGELKVETKEARTPARSDHSGGDDPVGRG